MSNKNIIWGKEQIEAIDKMVDFIQGEGEEIFTLSGISGSGKTTCVGEVLNRISKDLIIIGGAVSHAAKEVLSLSLGIECYTLAKLLGLKQKYSDEGEISFEMPPPHQNYMPAGAGADLLIIDECGMIDESLHNKIMVMKRKGCKVLYLGDASQLKPINDSEENSITFDYTKTTLSKAHRYSGPIFEMGFRMRAEIESLNSRVGANRHFINIWQHQELDNDDRVSKVIGNTGYIFLNSYNQLLSVSSKLFKESNNPNIMKVLAYRNKTIKCFGEDLRHMIYGDKSEEKFIIGESYITNNPYGPKGEIKNNTIFTIEDSYELVGPNGIDSFSLLLNPKPTISDGSPILALANERDPKYLEIASKLRIEAYRNPSKWPHYYRFINQWISMSYGTVCSIHKSQGRTYENVGVIESDVMSIDRISLKSKLQALYVACTRAKKIVFILNEKYSVDQSELPLDIKSKFNL